MCLAFNTTSHGIIAFGFFNIDTDMLLLERNYFFASAFCKIISTLADTEGDARNMQIESYSIPDPESVGDLMNAIRGINYTGFMGDVYRRFPFPRDPEEFKQKPEGVRNQAVLRELIIEYANPALLSLISHKERDLIQLGEYGFSRDEYQELIHYVWRGGYPRWRDEIRPDYVEDMKEKIVHSGYWVFSGLFKR